MKSYKLTALSMSGSFCSGSVLKAEVSAAGEDIQDIVTLNQLFVAYFRNDKSYNE